MIIGEYGADKAFYENNLTVAAARMRELEVGSCLRGFSGWLFWTSNVGDTDLRRFYSLYEGGGAINNQVKPTVRPNPAATTRAAEGEGRFRTGRPFELSTGRGLVSY